MHNKLPDFVKITPVVSVGDTGKLSVDEARWTGVVQKLSAIFKNYPKLQRSCVSFKCRQINRWLLTSEGTKIRDTQSKYLLHMMVTAQAEDGMSLSDWEIVGAPNEKQMPDYDKMEAIAKNMAERMTKLCTVPKGEDYCGPVMFEGQAAGEFLYTLLGPNISMAEEFIGQNSDQGYFEHWRNPLKDTLGRRILPKYVNLVDDPSLKEFKGVPLLGGYKYDDDGVAGKAITIAENGLLKGFCQGRVPTKHNSESNGHCFRGRSAPSILQLVATQTNSPAAMKQKLIELGKDAGLKYVLIVRKLNDNYRCENAGKTVKVAGAPGQSQLYSQAGHAILSVQSKRRRRQRRTRARAGIQRCVIACLPGHSSGGRRSRTAIFATLGRSIEACDQSIIHSW